ncbi:universal bacterial protein YeaZ [Acinetobacter sp. ANC 3929]|uniref:tRNA (adenosine(37)-N6)-threonylcarbamoyltransferase complex dimerization subunit type 1 TsaB n=1 Tax=unclassified Acinetobacter TaxID=196816 RepID=UPI0002D129E4|nr:MULTISPECIES: tRNA (adenosine(37)-N6)-threonylcarbamoyltransferase complex dimerization subunit type 1 TsaB [unclassified Acinetobacter]ENW82057.1 universal bacterial protein YeaZ [Acinetobacter sp. ANC 3929]MCH7352607.1 tRNA (adenosine(37)-N6)-threonylcarbamoyltransferase complex dimerization subunit type 1 TsaB [Acinetobacter sp. NIPH 2023]MCH7356653.1 tRNA (adenosine(37)-N6)-threonylcarbamoyltransferase complex dimerization subunit type 1 TsaB [Acinetobacter sp. NIPH 1958]MCH7360067.1 tRN
MKLLALETANEQCSVSLIDDTQELYFQLDERPKAQTQTILPLTEQALLQTKTQLADLTAIAFSRGPGSFSGVRINAAVTQALAWSQDLPVIPVSSLQALAQAAYRLTGLQQVSAVLDARMQEVYIANFSVDEQGIMQAMDDEKLLNYEQASAYCKFTAIGSGSELIKPSQIDSAEASNVTIMATAQDIAIIARVYAAQQKWVDAEHALPVYLRDDAWKKIPEQGKAN